MEHNLPTRKNNRLKEYDYSTNGMYFITVCTKDKKPLFWSDVGAIIGRPQDVVLSKYGIVVDDAINSISIKYPNIVVMHYVVMPNHIHLLLLIDNINGRPMIAPTISNVVNQLKGYVTKQAKQPIWQKSFYDHIIRNEQDLDIHMKYIEENPLKWALDELYCED